MNFVSNNKDFFVKSFFLLLMLMFFALLSRFGRASKTSKKVTRDKAVQCEGNTSKNYEPQQQQQLLKQLLKTKKEIPMNFVMFSIVEWDETEILNPRKIALNFGYDAMGTVEKLKDFFPILMGNECGYLKIGTLGQFEHFAQDEWVLVHFYATLQPSGKYRFRKVQKK
jgi:hypothetical protein